MAKKRKLNVINFILFVIIIILSIILVVTLFILGKLYFEQRSNEREENNTTDNVVETIDPTPIVEQTTQPVVRYTNNYDSDNCTTAYNELMLINAKYDVSLEFIEERKEEIIESSLSKLLQQWDGIRGISITIKKDSEDVSNNNQNVDNDE